MRYIIHPEVVSRELAGEHLLVPLTQGSADLRQLFALNETAAAVWSQLQQRGASVDELVLALEAEYDAPPEELRADIADLLQTLTHHALVVEQPDDAL